MFPYVSIIFHRLLKKNMLSLICSICFGQNIHVLAKHSHVSIYFVHLFLNLHYISSYVPSFSHRWSPFVPSVFHVFSMSQCRWLNLSSQDPSGRCVSDGPIEFSSPVYHVYKERVSGHEKWSQTQGI